MPGPDPICSSRTPHAPQPGLDAAALPTGVPAGEPHDVAHAVVHTTIEAAFEVGAELAGVESGAVAVGTTGFVGASLLGAGLAAFSSFTVMRGIVDARADGAVHGMLTSAFRDDSSPEGRAMALGYSAGLAGMNGAEIASLRASLPRGTEEWFLQGLANYDVDAEVHAEYLAEARAEYQSILREHGDGVAAAIGGWDAPGRGEAFRAGRERMQHYLDGHPCEAEALRGQYRAALRDGFRAADAGEIDHRRELFDPAYRAGVEHFRHVLHQGDTSALEAERRRIGGVSVRELAGGRIAG